MREWLRSIGEFLAWLASSILDFADQNTYLALLVVLVVEEAGVPLPVPGDTIILYAGYRISVGAINPFVAVLCVVVSTLVGSSALYWVARLGGHNLVFRYGRYIRLDEKKLMRMERWFQDHQRSAIVLGRLVPGLRIAVTIVAGIFEVSFRSFLLYTGLSAIIWAAIFLTAGFVLGRQYEGLTEYVVQMLGRPLIQSALALLVLIVAGWLLLRGRRRKMNDQRPPPRKKGTQEVR
jgi:membrane protein DedA with SNARE-associated domain